MIQVAVSMKRYDAVIVSYLCEYFGLRLEEAVTVRVFQIEEAIHYKQLSISPTARAVKNGYTCGY